MESDTSPLLARRMRDIKPSFIREILAAAGGNTISFAGGLPHPESFPAHEIRESADRAIERDGRSILQYTVTEWYRPLREWIAHRYGLLTGVNMSADDIIITNGSQQAFDLIGKAFVDPGDTILLESPTYLGALQAFEFFEPRYEELDLGQDGPNTEHLRTSLERHRPKFFYAIPAFQNPSGGSYSAKCRTEVARALSDHSQTILVEDDPYGELRFDGTRHRAIAADYEHSILLGSFSKIAAPGLRLGWIYAPRALREPLVIAKQAADLHSGHLTQAILHRFVTEHDFDAHIDAIIARYRTHRDAMVAALRETLPEARFSVPEGGMFLWVQLPGCDTHALFKFATMCGVTFVPWAAFSPHGGCADCMRLNYSNCDPETIRRGVALLAEAYEQYQKSPR